MLRVEVAAPKGALVHVYKDGQLLRSVTPEEAKSLSVPANGSGTDDLQVVVVTRSGDVMSTPVATDSASSKRVSANSKTKATSRRTVPVPKVGAKSGVGAGGKSATGKSGQRSTTDTVKPSTK
jgi:hypothetical protein